MQRNRGCEVTGQGVRVTGGCAGRNGAVKLVTGAGPASAVAGPSATRDQLLAPRCFGRTGSDGVPLPLQCGAARGGAAPVRSNGTGCELLGYGSGGACHPSSTAPEAPRAPLQNCHIHPPPPHIKGAAPLLMCDPMPISATTEPLPPAARQHPLGNCMSRTPVRPCATQVLLIVRSRSCRSSRDRPYGVSLLL